MEEDMMNNGGDFLNFVLPKNQSSYIKVMGVGGGGGNAVNHMYKQGIQGVDFVVCNTDAQALESSPVPTKIQLGRGLGAGNVPQVAKDAAIEKHDEIKNALIGTKMLFLTAGMGGGTGTGATPVVASIAKEIELTEDEVTRILTVAIVTMPFSFEGKKRIEQAKIGVSELRQAVDAILIINNDQLRKFGKMTLMEAFAMADNVLTTAAKSISEIITVKSYVQIDFKDVNTVMNNSGVALMGFGTAGGEDRAHEAVEAAMDSPLLNDNSIDGAKNILLYLSYGPDAPLDMDEIEIITQAILKRTGSDADMIWGAGEDETLGGNLNITLIATGFTEKNITGERVITRYELEDSKASAIPELISRGEKVAEPTCQVEEKQEESVEPVEAPRKKRQIAILNLDDEGTPVFRSEDAGTTTDTPAEESEVYKEAEKWLNDIDVLGTLSNKETLARETQSVRVVESAETVESVEAKTEEIPTQADGSGAYTIDFEIETREDSQFAAQENGETKEMPVVETVCAVEEPTAATGERQDVKKNMLQMRCEANAQRVSRLRHMSEMIRTQQGLNEMESVPAYRRQQLDLESALPSDVSEVSRTTIGLDGSLHSNPPFLSEKAD